MRREAIDNLVPSGEQPRREFQGVFLPWYIFDMVECGTLTANDAMVYAVINSLCDEDRNGCQASNAYLGKRMGISGGTAGRIANKLIRLGLVNKVSFYGRRRCLVICGGM